MITHKTPNEIELEVVRLYNLGFSGSHISAQGLCSKTTVERILKRHRIKMRTRQKAMALWWKRYKEVMESCSQDQPRIS